MKKADGTDADLELRPQYDFSKGVRGKYASRFREGSNVVVLDPDVARCSRQVSRSTTPCVK
jgi:hypothetical protein